MLVPLVSCLDIVDTVVVL